MPHTGGSGAEDHRAEQDNVELDASDIVRLPPQAGALRHSHVYTANLLQRPNPIGISKSPRAPSLKFQPAVQDKCGRGEEYRSLKAEQY